MDLLKSKWTVIGLCGYEIVAIHTSLPTITAISRRFPVVGVTLTTAIGWHFMTTRKEIS